MKKEDSVRLPDFYVVGAAKAGTTSLWYYLKQHPELYLVQDVKYKELGYFASDHGLSNTDDYATFFNDAKENQLIGEVCNSYLSDETCAEAIKSEVPHAKIIIILRDPILRAKSLYEWMRQEGYESISSFEMALNAEEERLNNPDFLRSNSHGNFRNYLYKETGLYYSQIKRYMDVFGRDNCLVCLFDDLKKSPSKLMNEMFDFLGVSNIVELNFEQQNISGSVRFPGLQNFLRTTVPKTRDKLGLPKGILSKPVNYILKKNKTSKKRNIDLGNELVESLRDYYKEDTNKTAQLINRDLSHWL